MKIDILTIFPEMFSDWRNCSIIKRAIGTNLVEINVHDIRKFTLDKNHRIDDYPTGGGAGLVMSCQPIVSCLNSVKQTSSHVILTSPRGNALKQTRVKQLAAKEHLVIICGHYEGVDERVNDYVDELISIGDFILTGGELVAMIISDSVTRLLKGVIADDSIIDESFENGLLEYPQYTLPRVFDGKKIPDIYFSGNHQAIKKYRLKESLRLTMKYRPDLLLRPLTKLEQSLIKELQENHEEPSWLLKALEGAHKFTKKIEN